MPTISFWPTICSRVAGTWLALGGTAVGSLGSGRAEAPTEPSGGGDPVEAAGGDGSAAEHPTATRSAPAMATPLHTGRLAPPPLRRARRLGILALVPVFMDRHEFSGLTAEEAAAAHIRDLEVQGQFGVRFVTYWFDDERQTAFCLAIAPDKDAVESVHRASHGYMAYQIIEVDQPTVERFMGGIVEHPPGEPYVDTAFRTILFTDIEGSTSLTQRLGDARSMAVLRHHDEIVREALGRHGGSMVKHTGDGVMAAFSSVVGGIESAVRIQRQLASANATVEVPLQVRVGLSAGEPVTERDDLFGAAVQLAARLCDRADPGSILVSSAVHDLAMGKGFTFEKRRPLRLKGFEGPIQVYQVDWAAGESN
jgi:class 3 adenylate cyclase